MQLAACLVSSDLTPLYYEFFPLVHRAWREIVGVRVVLALVADEIPAALAPYAEDIIRFPPVRGVDTAFHAQCVRLLAPQLLEVPSDQAVIISDVDMIPMSRDYYVVPLALAALEQFVVYRSNALPPESREFPICYNAATRGVWAEVFGKVAGIAEVNRVVSDWSAAVTTSDGRWSADQRLLYDRVARFEASRVKLVVDRDTGFARLDRGGMGKRLSPLQASLVARRYYADYHMKRPYAAFASLNDRIAAMAAKGVSRPLPIDRAMYGLDRMLRRAFG
jgi:hypothetical protein